MDRIARTQLAQFLLQGLQTNRTGEASSEEQESLVGMWHLKPQDLQLDANLSTSLEGLRSLWNGLVRSASGRGRKAACGRASATPVTIKIRQSWSNGIGKEARVLGITALSLLS